MSSVSFVVLLLIHGRTHIREKNRERERERAREREREELGAASPQDVTFFNDSPPPICSLAISDEYATCARV